MRLIVDTSVLLYLAYPNAPPPHDSKGNRVAHCEQRIEGFLEEADAASTEIIIPTPAVSELLIRAQGRQAEVLAAIVGKRAVVIAPFDLQAAVENAALKRDRALTKPFVGQARKEVSFDLQILAIARVWQADLVLTDDGNLRKRCEVVGIKVKGIADLPVPESKRQLPMQLDTKKPVEESRVGAPVGAPSESPNPTKA